MRYSELFSGLFWLLLGSNINEFKINLLLSNWLLNFFDALVQRKGFNLINLGWEDLRSLNWCSLDKDITPHLLPEAVVITMDKSEERDVVSCDAWSLHFHRNINLLAWLDKLVNVFRGSLEIITIGLNEEGIFGPVLITSISEGPGLGESFSSEKRISVTEALLNKSSLVNCLLLLRLLVALSLRRLAR